MTTSGSDPTIEQAIGWGSEQLKQNRFEDAQRTLRAALERDKANLKLLALLGLAHFRAAEFAAARPIYEQLCARAPSDATHRLNLGLVYLKLNDAARAIDALEASRALDPSQGRAVSYLGLAYARAGRYADAFRAFLLAGQHDLATEIEINVPAGERDAIVAQLGPAAGRTRTPSQPVRARTPSPHVIPRTVSPSDGSRPSNGRTPTPSPPTARTPSEPRTRPPTAPPGAAHRGATGDLTAKAAAAVELVARGDFPRDAELVPEVSSPEITIVRETSDSHRALSESMQFVIGREAKESLRRSHRDAIQAERAGAEAPDPAAPQAILPPSSMVSIAVASASPAAPPDHRTGSGGLAARPLSELATEHLIRPDDSSESFEISDDGTLLIRIRERVITRLDGVHVTGGDLAFEVATRRSRGSQTDQPFDAGGLLHSVTGSGFVVAAASPDYKYTALHLDDDIFYVREDLIYAFEPTLRWENGNVPGLRGRLSVVQFRGDGTLALRLARPLQRVKLAPQGLLFVDVDRLAGWVGRVIPRAVVPPPHSPLGTLCVECTGEGIVLIEPLPPRTPSVQSAVAATALPLAAPAPPPPPPAEVSPEVADFAAALAAPDEP